MKKIIASIEQVTSICGDDFTKWPNKMAPDVLKATYEMLKEYQEQLNRHGSVEIFSESDREQILEKVKSFYENKLAEKDKEYVILLADRDKLEMYRHNQLKKSDITLHYIECNESESEEFCDDNNLFKVVNEFEHDENCGRINKSRVVCKF